MDYEVDGREIEKREELNQSLAIRLPNGWWRADDERSNRPPPHLKTWPSYSCCCSSPRAPERASRVDR